MVGSGAAGLSAAIYAGRYKLRTFLIEGEFGGETATAGTIWNYPGFNGIDGYELMRKMKEQAQSVGVEFRDGWVKEIRKEGECFRVLIEERSFHTNTVIIATGSRRRHLNLPNEKELTGKGVHYCWTCDGPLYKDKIVAMVGGGDSSVKGINFLSAYAKKIYFIVKEKEIGAEPLNLEQMRKLGDHVEILLETEVKEIRGKEKLETLILSRPYKESRELAIDGLFIEIGFDPDQTFAKQLGLEIDSKGYTKTDSMMRTNVPGIFAAGDATNHFNNFKQDITAAALGTVAATAAYEHYKANGKACDLHKKVP